MTTPELESDFSIIDLIDRTHPAWKPFVEKMRGREWGGDVLRAAWTWFRDGWIEAAPTALQTAVWNSAGCVARARIRVDELRVACIDVDVHHPLRVERHEAETSYIHACDGLVFQAQRRITEDR